MQDEFEVFLRVLRKTASEALLPFPAWGTGNISLPLPFSIVYPVILK
jgi:hypothetical protein